MSRLIENLARLSHEEGRAMNLTATTGAIPTCASLLVEISNRIATVTLNRPKSLNAVNVPFFEKRPARFTDL